MKKILFLIIAGCLGLVSTSQTLFPSTQGYATPTTLFNPRGGITASAAFINSTYADTTAANAANPYTKSYAGSQIFTTSDTALWYRSVGTNRWIKVSGGNGNGSGGGGGGGNVLSLTNGLTLTSGVGYWGGPLVQNTLITGAGYKLRFDGLDSFTVRYGTTKRFEIGAISTLMSSPDYQNLVSVLDNGINLLTTNGNGVIVRDTSVQLLQHIYIPNIRSGVTSDSFLVWNSFAGEVRKIPSSSFGAGSVTSFSTGNLPPLFTASVANPTTNPALSFTLSNAAAKTVYWNNQSSTAAPAFNYLDTSAFGGTGQWNTYVLNNSKLFAVGDSRAAEARYFSGGNAYNLILDSIQFVVKGAVGVGQTVPTHTGSIMFFNPKKAAFRAGYYNHSEWTDSYIGIHSAAFGVNSIVSGNYGMGWGISNLVTGVSATSWGEDNTASGRRATSFGSGSIASGYNATAWGDSALSSAQYATSFGTKTQALTYGGTVIGRYNDSTFSNPDSYVSYGRAFEIGNGTDYGASRSNALTMLFNGETIIGGSTRDSSALLRLNSTTKGFLAPRVTGTQMNAVVTPSTGLLVYNTDSTAFCYYNGVTWVKIGTGTGGVGTVVSVASGDGMSFSTITGTGTVTLGTPSSVTLASTNSVSATSHTHAFAPGGTSSQVILGDGTLGTYNGGNAWLLATNAANAGTDRFGTSNNVSLRIQTNATERMVVDSNGRVGIGTVAPNVSSLLHISSTTKGFLKPVVTGTQMNAISTPATGLEVYNTDSVATCYYNGAAWVKVSAASAGAAGTVTSVATGYGTLGGTITTSGTVRFDSATVFPQLLNTISLLTTGSDGPATWNPTTRILNIPEYQSGSGSGTVTNVIAGDGMDFSPITTTGTVTLGTPSSISFSSTNLASTATHTHALTFPSNSDSVILGDGTRGIYLRNAWTLSGNAATAGTDRLGTTNNTSLRILTNSIERMVLDSNGRIGIGTVAPNSTAKLEVSSTTQGVLIPRLTGIQQAAISSPATSLLIYNTDSVAFCYYNGAAWVKIGAATGGGGGGGSGTVTSLSHGYGIINTPNPITSTGTIVADTAIMFPAVISTIALTTVGTSGVATWNPTTRTLNVPQYIGGGGGSGWTTLAPIGSSPNANGASSSGVTLNLQPADSTYGGVISTTTQTMGDGYKTFTKDLTVNYIRIGTGPRTSGNDSLSTVMGRGVLAVNTSGYDNTVMGYRAMTSNTTGHQNTAIGGQVLKNNTTGQANVGLGGGALYSNTTGYANTAIGYFGLYFNTTGTFNSALGDGALAALTTGSYNTAFGTSSAAGITTGSNNVAIGYGPMIYTTGGVTGNVAIGTATLLNTRTNNQVAIGGNALTYNTTGEGNVAVGEAALSSNTTGGFNTAVGTNSLDYNTTGNYNTAMGTSALLFNTSGARNVAIGLQALLFNQGGDQNVAVGSNALFYNTSGQKNIAVGPGASENNSTGSLNVAVGQDALLRTTTGSGNIGIGWNAMATTVTSSNNVAVGYGAGKTVILGPNNVFMGRDAGWNASQNDSVTGSIAIGHSSYTTKDSLAVFGASYIKETWLRGKTGVSVENPDSVLQVSGGVYTNRGVRHTNLPTTVQARVAMIGTDGTMYSADTTGLFPGGGAGSRALSAITPALTTNDINSGNYAQAWRWNSLTTQTAFTWSSSSITTGKLFDIQLTGTHTMGGQVAFNIATTQANGDAPGFGTNYAAKISNGTTVGTGYTNYGLWTESVGTGGTTVENIGLVAKATGGTTNYAIIVPTSSGLVGIGTSTPDSLLTVSGGGLYTDRGVRHTNLPTGAGTKALRINASTGVVYMTDTVPGGGSGSRFAYTNEDTIATANRRFNTAHYNFTIDSIATMRLRSMPLGGATYAKMDFNPLGYLDITMLDNAPYPTTNRIYTDAPGDNGFLKLSSTNSIENNTFQLGYGGIDGTSDLAIRFTTSLAGKSSILDIKKDSIKFYPSLGVMSIDSLATASSMTNKAVMVWDSTTARWQRISATSVVSGGGGAVNIYNTNGTLTGPRTLTGDDNSLSFTGVDVMGIASYDFNVLTTNEINLDANSFIRISSQNATTSTRNSLFYVQNDSINFQPYQGVISIDTLALASSMINKAVMVWDSASKRWQRISAASVVSSGGGGGTTWNAITNPTGTQTLTFDDGELNAWTNNNTTSNFHTITSNAQTTGYVNSFTSSSLTTGRLVNLAITGTAAGNYQGALYADVSGANASPSITTYGINVKNSHTGTTPINIGVYAEAWLGAGTNTGLYAAASGTGSLNTAGEFQVSGASSSNIGVRSNASGSATINYAASFTANGGGAATNTGLSILVGSATNNYAIITSGGNVGISTASPTALLEVVAPSTITTGIVSKVYSTYITSGTVLDLTSVSTALAANNEVLNIAMSGANGTSGITATGGRISVTNTGTTSTNVGIDITTSGATNNYTLKLTDGLQGAGKVLTSDASGNAYWAVTGAAGSVAWNAITNPTGTQTLTFDDGELNAWTNSSNTETFQTITSNSLTTGVVFSMSTSSLTSGTILDLTSTSTALASGNQGLNITLSGANATNGITAIGARISVTNTNATSGTNVGLTINVNGATTANKAIVATGGIQFASFGAGTATFDAVGNISSVSDSRLKNIQTNYKGGTKELMNITPIVFKWNEKSGMEQSGNYIGFSAQNIKESLGEGSFGINKDGYYSIQDRAIIAVLVNSVKELTKRVEQLEKR